MLNIVILYTIAVLLRFQLGNAEQRFVPNIPEECQHLGYCNLPQPDYPKEHVERLIQTLGLQNANQSVVTSINPIRKWNPQEIELCAYVEQEFIPLVAQDTNGNWNFIINTIHYPQTYCVQICNQKGLPCASVAHFYPGYNASCDQNFIKKVIKAIDHKGNILLSEHRIPSNCYCKVIENGRHRNTGNEKSLHVKQDCRNRNPEDVKSLHVKQDSRNRNPEDVKTLHSKILGKKYHKDSKGYSGRS